MSQDEAKQSLLKLAEQMDDVKQKCAAMGRGVGSLNQVAWLGEITCGMGDTIRVALGAKE